MIVEKRLGDAHDHYDRNGKKESPEELLTKARSEEMFARPEKSELNGPPTLLDHLKLGVIAIVGIGSLLYFIFWK